MVSNEMCAQKFADLIDLEDEQALVDFKEKFYNLKKTSETDELLKDIVAMYNTPVDVASQIPSVTHQKLTAAYIVFGVICVDSRPNNPVPRSQKLEYRVLTEDNKINVASVQDIIQQNISVNITVNAYDVRLDGQIASRIPRCNQIFHKCGRKQSYFSFLEILRETDEGPAYFTPKGKHRLEKRNKLGDSLWFRRQAKNDYVRGDSRGFEMAAKIENYFGRGYDKQEYLGKLTDVTRTTKPYNHAFKILVIDLTGQKLSCTETAQNVTSSEDTVTDMCEAIGNIHWNVVVDLTEELEDVKEKYANMDYLKTYIQQAPVAYTWTDITEQSNHKNERELFKEIRDPCSKAFLLVTPLKPDKNLSLSEHVLKISSKLRYKVTLIFEGMLDQQQLLLYLVSLSHGKRSQAHLQILHCLKQAWIETGKENQGLISCIITDRKSSIECDEDISEILKHLKKEKKKHSKCIVAVAPISQITHCFKALAPFPSVKQGIQLPAKPGKVTTIAHDDARLLEAHLEIYGTEKGEKEFNNFMYKIGKSGEEACQEIQTNFIKGQKISPELMYVKSEGWLKSPGYARRPVYKNLLDMAQATLESLSLDQDRLKAHRDTIDANRRQKKQYDKIEKKKETELLAIAPIGHLNPDTTNPKIDDYPDCPNFAEIVHVFHKPSAGGTTAGRLCLWELRKYYPCAELLDLDNETFQSIRNTIHKKTNLPVCLLIDANNIPNATTEMINEKLLLLESVKDPTDDVVPVLIIFVHEASDEDPHEFPGQSVFVDYDISRDDKYERIDFDNLYETSGNQLAHRTEGATMVLFGLMQFDDKYSPFDNVLANFRKASDSLPESIALMSCICYVICNRCVFPMSLATAMLEFYGADPENDIFEKLGDYSHFLVYERARFNNEEYYDGLRPATNFVAQKLLQKLFDGNRQAVSRFFTDFAQYLEKEDVKACANLICLLAKELFIQRGEYRADASLDDVEADAAKQNKPKFAPLVEELSSHEGPEKAHLLLNKTIEAINKAVTMRTAEDHTPQHLFALEARFLAYRLKNHDNAISTMRRALDLDETDDFTKCSTHDLTLLTIAGSMFSLKLGWLCQTTAFDEEKLHVYHEIMQPAIFLFERAQKQGKVLAYIDEAELQSTYINLYFEQKHKGDFGAFSIDVNSTKDKYLSAARTTAEKKLERATELLAIAPIGHLNPDTTYRRVDKIRRKLIYFRVDRKTITLARYENLCHNEPALAVSIVDFIQLQNGENRKKFCEFTKVELQSIVSVLTQKDLPENYKTITYYRNLIRAQIYYSNRIVDYAHLRPKEDVEAAYKFALSWSRLNNTNTQSDCRAYYYIGLLLFVQAFIPENHVQTMRILTRAYDKLKQYDDEKPKDVDKRREFHSGEQSFVVTTDQGLKMLMPDDVYQKQNPKPQLRIFYGRAESQLENHMLALEGHPAHKMSKVTVPRELRETRELRLNELLRYGMELRVTQNGLCTQNIWIEDQKNLH